MDSRRRPYKPQTNRRPYISVANHNTNKVFIGKDKGEEAVIKRIPLYPGEITNETSKRYWEDLIKLRDDNLVQYRSFSLQNDVRYLTMEVCQGSMVDYCRGTLDNAVAQFVKGTDVMWQITCAVDYLYRQRIGHGDLELEKVLFFLKRDTRPERVVVKLSGYGYNYLQSADDIKTDFYKLGSLYYSAVTRKEIKPIGAITSTRELTEISADAKQLALELINLVTDGLNRSSMEAGTLLRHPLFIRYCEHALPRLIKEQESAEAGRQLNRRQNLTDFKITLGDGQLRNSFKRLKKIFLSDEKTIKESLEEAYLQALPILSQYIWHISTTPSASARDNGGPCLEKVTSIGRGSYGKVYQCIYTNEEGKSFPVAGKKITMEASTEEEIQRTEEEIQREIKTLSQLKHLFVVEYLAVKEISGKKYMVMELCEGSLKQYVEGNLAQIQKDSLDDKKIISQVTLGLAYIHSKGIIHKDLKLENILLKRPFSEAVLVMAKIADFGLAKHLRQDSSEFSLTQRSGTETYLAPELINAPDKAYRATFASDAYALGMTIVRLALKGNHPFTSHKLQRSISMAKGLVPDRLHSLSWDLIDLIVKLMQKDPAQRPIVALVLRHPYFVLTNSRTQRHFVDQIWTDLELLSPDDRTKQMKIMFDESNFNEWYEDLIADKPETAEERTQMENTIEEFQKINPNLTAESLNPAKPYKQIMKTALKDEYDANIGYQTSQIVSVHGVLAHDYSRNHRVSRLARQETSETSASYGTESHQTSSTHRLQNHLCRNSLHRLVQRKPMLMVSYLWSRLVDMINNLSVDPSAATIASQQTPTPSAIRKDQMAQFKHWITSELEWSSLYYGDQEETVDQLWKIKYPKTSWPEETTGEMTRRLAKCNVSLTVWSELLDGKWMGKSAPLLLGDIVQSHEKNAPKIAEKILQKHWFKEEKLTSVHLAAFNEGEWAADMMRVLMDCKRDPKAATEDGLTPIHIAALNESSSGPKLVQLLLDNKADPNSRFHGGTTPVHWAAMNHGNHAVDILKLLVEQGGRRDDIDQDGLEPIHYATVNTGDCALKLVDLLFEQRAANKADSAGRTLLHFAVFNERGCAPAMLAKLLEKGENPNAADKKKRTPLHLTARHEKAEQSAIMSILLTGRSDPNAADQLGRTPVHYATANEAQNADEKLNLLLRHGGILSIKDKHGLTPVHYAAINEGKCGEAMRKLVGVTPEKINARLNKNSETLLHYLIGGDEGQAELVQMVLDNGGDPNVRDACGRSPVHSVVMLNESLAGLNVLRLLLARGGDVNLADKEKQWTPVHYVASSTGWRLPEKMEILLASGGDVNAQGRDGSTPLHLAVANAAIDGPQLTRMLLKVNANPDAINIQKRTPLHEAMANENGDIRLDAVRQLLEKGADPNARDGKGLTPVHHAVQCGRAHSVKIVKLLLQHGGDMAIKDDKEMTPLRLAEYCLPECLTVLKS